jgi:hypothetical protein
MGIYTNTFAKKEYEHPAQIKISQSIKLGDPKVVTISLPNVLEEYFSSNQLLNNYVEGRLVYK